MKTGIIIINYNDFESTRDLLNQVKDFSIIDKIVVVDNCSTDDSLRRLKKLQISKCDVLEAQENRGYSAAINLGSHYLIEKLGTCNLIISNPDVIISKEEDLKELLDLLKKEKVGVVGPTILEHESLNRGWKNPSPWIDSLMNLPYIHRYFRKKFVFYKEDYYSKDVSEVEVLSGCFFCLTSKTMEKIGFLDENVFLYYEENILAHKMKEAGLINLVDNQVLIIHNHSVSIDRSLNKIKKYCAQKKSQYYFQTTYHQASTLAKASLKITKCISQIILTIYYYFLDLKTK